MALEPHTFVGMMSVDTPARRRSSTLIVADVDVLKDNEVDDVKLSHSCCCCCCHILASKDVVEPYGLWLLMLRNPSDDVVKQDDATVGLLLTLSVGEVCMLAHHLVVVVAAAQLLVLSICTSPSSLSL